MIRSRWAHGLALVVVVLSLVLPGQGILGFDGRPLPLCHFKTVTHLPCPGCGLTRSFIHMAHLKVIDAAFYNPVGVVLFPFTLYLAVLLFVRPEARDRMARWVERRALPVNVLAGVLAAVFVVNGIGRIAWLLSTSRPSPW